MSNLPPCPECNSEYSYEDREMLVCSDADMNGKKVRRKACLKMKK